MKSEKMTKNRDNSMKIEGIRQKVKMKLLNFFKILI
jgi:hypothetical protein